MLTLFLGLAVVRLRLFQGPVGLISEGLVITGSLLTGLSVAIFHTHQGMEEDVVTTQVQAWVFLIVMTVTTVLNAILVIRLCTFISEHGATEHRAAHIVSIVLFINYIIFHLFPVVVETRRILGLQGEGRCEGIEGWWYNVFCTAEGRHSFIILSNLCLSVTNSMILLLQSQSRHALKRFYYSLRNRFGELWDRESSYQYRQI
eukprot:sb/3470577/